MRTILPGAGLRASRAPGLRTGGQRARGCLLLAALLATATTVFGQAAPAGLGPGLLPTRLEVYGGYGYFRPYNSDIGYRSYRTIPAGGVGSITGYYNRYLGLQLEGAAFPSGPQENDCVYTAQAGPVVRYPKGRFVPFFHALGGASKIGGPAEQPCKSWGWGITGGLGLDYVLPAFSNRIAVRAVQADAQYSQIQNGPLVLPVGVMGGFGEVYDLRLSAGFVLRLGHVRDPERAAETTMTCSADPASVYAGDPITLSANVLNLHTAKPLLYEWSSTGGRVSGEAANATLSTVGLAPASYSVTGKIMQAGRPMPLAMCTSSFTVRPPEPPTVTCAADRSAINSGDPVTITAAGISPQGRPLTFAFSSTNGQIIPNAQVTSSLQTAQLSTAGATPGTITVTCGATDDQGATASGHVSVVIATPALPPSVAVASTPAPLCSLRFDRDRRRPDRVDNAAKACLDDIALALYRDPASKLVLIGNHDAGETNRNAAERVLNAADYLTNEKDIDAQRILLRIAAEPARSVTTLLVPAGGIVDPAAGSSFDRSSVVRRGQPYSRSVPGTSATRKRAQPW